MISRYPPQSLSQKGTSDSPSEAWFCRLPLLSIGVALGIVSAVHGGFHAISFDGPTIVPNTAVGLLVATALIVTGMVSQGRRSTRDIITVTPWLAVLSLVLVTDIPTRWPSVLNGGIGLWHILVVALVAAVLFSKFHKPLGYFTWLAGVIAAYLGLREATGGELLFSDDHPAFLYRITQLKEHFPSIPFYNPMWNGGVEAREFFPSGILNAFFLLAPLIYLLDPVLWYNELVVILLFVIHPACTWLAVRILRLDAPFAPVVALLSSTLWFRYQFHYGTLGFLTSVALVPFLFALVVRICEERKEVSWSLLLATAVVATLTAFWTPALFIVLPGLVAVARPLIAFALSKKGVVLIGMVLVLNIPWLLIFIEASGVFRFVATPQSGETAIIEYPSPMVLLSHARYALRAAAPVIPLLAIPGLMIMRRDNPRSARIFFSSIVVLFAVGLLVAPLKPRLELERLLLVAVHLCSIPVGAALRHASSKPLARLASSIAAGSVLLTPASVYLFTANRTPEPYSAYASELPGLVEAIKQHSQGGRIAFSGYVQHELGGGHVTPLPLFTGVPLYASRYQHDRWVHTDFIPTQFRKEHDIGIEKFFDLYNITGIAVHDPEWLPWFSARPDYYTRLWSGKTFTLFSRRFGPRSWFIEGQGEVIDQSQAEIRLRLDTPEVLIRFNWLPFLETKGCSSISPQLVYEGIEFIRLKGCTTEHEVTVSAKSAVSRILD